LVRKIRRQIWDFSSWIPGSDDEQHVSRILQVGIRIPAGHGFRIESVKTVFGRLRIFLIGSLLMAWIPASVQAATANVDTTADGVDAIPGDGVCATAAGACTLRAAVQELSNIGPPRPHTINLPPGTYILTLAGAGEDAGATGDLDILDDMAILGTDPRTTIIDGNALDRVIDIDNAVDVTIVGVTIRNGNVPGGNGGGIRFPNGDLTLTDVTVSGNTAGFPDRRHHQREHGRRWEWWWDLLTDRKGDSDQRHNQWQYQHCGQWRRNL
jgi:hypothetical protein